MPRSFTAEQRTARNAYYKKWRAENKGKRKPLTPRQRKMANICSRRHMTANKEYYKLAARKFRELHPGYLNPARLEKTNRVKALKENTPCADCGGKFPACCMDFDHRELDKYKEVGVLVSSSATWEVIQTEIDKCDIVCANCHRVRTSRRGGKGWRRKNVLEVQPV